MGKSHYVHLSTERSSAHHVHNSNIPTMSTCPQRETVLAMSTTLTFPLSPQRETVLTMSTTLTFPLCPQRETVLAMSTTLTFPLCPPVHRGEQCYVHNSNIPTMSTEGNSAYHVHNSNIPTMSTCPQRGTVLTMSTTLTFPQCPPLHRGEQCSPCPQL